MPRSKRQKMLFGLCPFPAPSHSKPTTGVSGPAQDSSMGDQASHESEGNGKGEGEGEWEREGSGEGEISLYPFVPVIVDAINLHSTDLSAIKKATTQNLTKGSSHLLFDWLIAPLSAEKFYSEIWEKTPVLIRRPAARRYASGLFGKSDVEGLLESGLLFGLNVDVTKYENGQRQTLNGEGLADPEVVWGKYKEGCSVRLLHPQRWNDNLWWLLSTLERHFDQLTGCNVYLTPSASQGFSPHYDDIDAFILQLEGTKRWRCYRPPTPPDYLARFPSPAYEEEDIGEPILDTMLEPGDLLYMPRGTVHQAESTAEGHSLHLTISTGQRNTMADFLQMALPRALELASEEDIELRKSLPLNVFDFMGVVNSDNEVDPRREAFKDRIKSCMMKILESGPWDSAVDQLAGNFIHHRLPPFQLQNDSGHAAPLQSSKNSTKGEGGDGKRAFSERQRHAGAEGKSQLSVKSMVAAVVEGGCRLIVEDDSAVVYHMMDNTREEHNEGGPEDEADESKGRIEFPLECASWLEEFTSLSASKPTRISEILERCNQEYVGRKDKGAVLSIVKTLIESNVLQLRG